MKIRVAEHVMARRFGDRWLLIDLSDGSSFGLESMAALVWTGLAEGLSPEAVCDRVQEQFDVPRQQLDSDVSAFISSLLRRGLVNTEGT